MVEQVYRRGQLFSLTQAETLVARVQLRLGKADFSRGEVHSVAGVRLSLMLSQETARGISHCYHCLYVILYAVCRVLRWARAHACGCRVFCLGMSNSSPRQYHRHPGSMNIWVQSRGTCGPTSKVRWNTHHFTPWVLMRKVAATLLSLPSRVYRYMGRPSCACLVAPANVKHGTCAMNLVKQWKPSGQ